MKLAKLFVTLGALVSLVACGSGESGTKVSGDKFVEKASAVEANPYNQATLKVSASGAGESEKYNSVYFINSDGSWTYVSGDQLPEGSAAQFSLKADYWGTYYYALEVAGQLPEGYKLSYYVNPFKIVVRGTTTQDYSGQTITTTTNMALQFNSYGLLASSSSKITMKANGQSVTIVENVSVTYSTIDVA